VLLTGANQHELTVEEPQATREPGRTMSPEEMQRWGLRVSTPADKEQAQDRLRDIAHYTSYTIGVPPQQRPQEPPTPAQEAETKATAWAFATGNLGALAPPPTSGTRYPQVMTDLQHVVHAVIACRADTQQHLAPRGLTPPERAYAAGVTATAAQFVVFMQKLVLGQEEE
jgi:hypothetical protein